MKIERHDVAAREPDPDLLRWNLARTISGLAEGWLPAPLEPFRERADLADALRRWLVDKATALQEAAQRVPAVRFDSKHQKRGGRNQGDSTRSEGQSCLPLTRLPADMPLFTVPAGLVRILDRDLVAVHGAGKKRIE